MRQRPLETPARRQSRFAKALLAACHNQCVLVVIPLPVLCDALCLRARDASSISSFEFRFCARKVSQVQSKRGFRLQGLPGAEARSSAGMAESTVTT